MVYGQEQSPRQRRARPEPVPAEMTTTSNAPRTLEDLEKLLYYDRKVKIAGERVATL